MTPTATGVAVGPSNHGSARNLLAFTPVRRNTFHFDHQNNASTATGTKETGSPYVRVSKVKLTSIITQLLSLLCEDHEEAPVQSAVHSSKQSKSFNPISDAAANLMAAMKETPEMKRNLVNQ